MSAETNKSLLPAGFESLERFAAWVLETETLRNRKRLESSMEEIREFYDAMMAELDAVMQAINHIPLPELSEPQRNLLYLLLSLAEVTPAVENYDQPAVPDGFDSARFPAVEDFAMRPSI